MAAQHLSPFCRLEQKLKGSPPFHLFAAETSQGQHSRVDDLHNVVKICDQQPFSQTFNYRSEPRFGIAQRPLRQLPQPHIPHKSYKARLPSGPQKRHESFQVDQHAILAQPVKLNDRWNGLPSKPVAPDVQYAFSIFLGDDQRERLSLKFCETIVTVQVEKSPVDFDDRFPRIYEDRVGAAVNLLSRLLEFDRQCSFCRPVHCQTLPGSSHAVFPTTRKKWLLAQAIPTTATSSSAPSRIVGAILVGIKASWVLRTSFSDGSLKR